jgi:hypothetical protein
MAAKLRLSLKQSSKFKLKRAQTILGKWINELHGNAIPSM